MEGWKAGKDMSRRWRMTAAGVQISSQETRHETPDTLTGLIPRPGCMIHVVRRPICPDNNTTSPPLVHHQQHRRPSTTLLQLTTHHPPKLRRSTSPNAVVATTALPRPEALPIVQYTNMLHWRRRANGDDSR